VPALATRRAQPAASGFLLGMDYVEWAQRGPLDHRADYRDSPENSISTSVRPMASDLHDEAVSRWEKTILCNYSRVPDKWLWADAVCTYAGKCSICRDNTGGGRNHGLWTTSRRIRGVIGMFGVAVDFDGPQFVASTSGRRCLVEGCKVAVERLARSRNIPECAGPLAVSQAWYLS